MVKLGLALLITLVIIVVRSDDFQTSIPVLLRNTGQLLKILAQMESSSETNSTDELAGNFLNVSHSANVYRDTGNAQGKT